MSGLVLKQRLRWFARGTNEEDAYANFVLGCECLLEEVVYQTCVQSGELSDVASVCVTDDEVHGGEWVLVRCSCVFRINIGCVGRDDHVRGEIEVGLIVVNVGKAYAPGGGFWSAA